MRESEEVDRLMKTLGLNRNLEKCVWGKGTTRIEFLEAIWDTTQIALTTTPTKVGNIRKRAQ